jgi:uncharacterized protein (TIGR00255 family)
MTGYGKAEFHIDDKSIMVEIRSLNSKNIDLKTRIPSVYREKESEIRKLIANQLKRGKIDFQLTIESLVDQPKNQINTGILNNYLQQLKAVQPNADETQLLVAALRLPDVLQYKKEDLDEAEWQKVRKVIDEAIAKMITYRKDEGATLEKDLLVNLDNIQQYLDQIAAIDGGRVEEIKTRLHEALSKLKIDVDQNRFEQELIYYLEKLDINEEKVRLNSHLQYFRQEFETKTVAKGKKLAFISQEMGREINTIGSKSNNSQMQQLVVKMKDELEKIKEQMLNIL